MRSWARRFAKELPCRAAIMKLAAQKGRDHDVNVMIAMDWRGELHGHRGVETPGAAAGHDRCLRDDTPRKAAFP
jgi:hypothetical protein